MTKVKCFECGKTVDIDTAKKQNWYINRAKWKEGFWGTCPADLEFQREEETHQTVLECYV